MSFYKKKYEENSANYQSMSDNLKNKNTDIIETNNSLKISKNEIMLTNDSSDEDEDDEIDL